MNIFKRVWLSVGSSVDSFAGKLENHEAVAEGITGDMEQAAVPLRSEHTKTRNEVTRLEQSLSQQKTERDLWTGRARKSAESDREKAIQCVKFVKNAEQRITEIEGELTEVRKVERELLSNVTEGEQRLGELRRKKRVLSSRQSRAEVTSFAKNAGGNVFGEAEDLFSRWEAKVGSYEGVSENSSTEEDLMAMEFATEEEQAELDSLLNDIIDNK